MLFDTVLAFDHVQHRILIIANARITPDEDLESLYQFACAKIQFLERELERSLSHTRRRRRRARSTFTSNHTRERFEAQVRDGEGAHRRRRHLPGRAVAALRGRGRRPIRSPSTARCATSTRRRTCISSAWAASRSSARRRRCWCASRARASRRIRSPAPGRAARTDEEDLRLAEELKRNEKERAEHVMLVDLGRNDVGRVCEYGIGARAAVHGARALLARHAPGLDRRGQAGRRSRSARRAGVVLPGRHGVRRAEGPRDADHRASSSRRGRGLYAGAVGYLDFAGNLDFCIAIRTIMLATATPTCRPAPASSPTRTRRRSTRRRATRRARCCARSSWRRRGCRRHGPRHRQLRFVHLQPRAVPRRARAPTCGSCATTRSRSTRSRRCSADADRHLARARAARGRRHHDGRDPASSAQTTPILGVCLGHQAIGAAFGGDGRARAARRCTARRRRSSTTATASSRGIAGPFLAARYHSLVVAESGLPAELEVTARTARTTARSWACGTARWPVHGVQFHPESVLTGEGQPDPAQLPRGRLTRCSPR